MDLSNNFTSLNPDFSDSSSSDLTVQTSHFDTNEQHPTYQGMSVQTMDTPLSVYHSQSDMHENNADDFNLLSEYNIDSPTFGDLADAFGINILDIQQSFFNEYIPFNSDTRSVNPLNDVQSQRPATPFTQQMCLSGSDPWIGASEPSSYSSPDDQLADSPPVLPNPHDLQPVTVANPPSLGQTARDMQTIRTNEITDINSATITHQKKRYQNDPGNVERHRQRQRERYRNNPDYAEQQRERQRERKRELRKNPAYVEQERVRQKERRKNPAYAERERERVREMRKKPGYLERRREYQRQRYQNDPEYAERRRECNRNLRKDPVYAQRERERRKELRKDPTYAEHKKKLRRQQKKELRDDPVYAEPEKELRKGPQPAGYDFSEVLKPAPLASDQYPQPAKTPKTY
ncbi:hypothetical protein [Endozoicomonas sp. SESOKO1]|uniref:hypothetical protein n=1 Tax=Endozoicomonas sp. SESOKO1 TaxID=2828742 RepID=UPI0021474F93|nr:hypothetical protein [Endozoicomonas sp. SESOKO1]